MQDVNISGIWVRDVWELYYLYNPSKSNIISK